MKIPIAAPTPPARAHKISKTLEEADSSLENVVNATVYLTDLNDRPKYLNPVWSELFPKNPPTRTCIQVGLAPPAVAEITVIAIIPE
jgi:enamine deaminase RidA (YjgF/YER057c/UK114 family)